ncbi:unnamed protein product, partial [Amoebophrya sp. A25]
KNLQRSSSSLFASRSSSLLVTPATESQQAQTKAQTRTRETPMVPPEQASARQVSPRDHLQLQEA